MIAALKPAGGAGLLDDLRWRGLVHQCTDEAIAGRAFAEGSSAYIGFDPTAPSLHIGSLQQILLLRRLQDAGQRPIALIGGGTGMIGDPSGKSAERTLQGLDTIAGHADGIRTQLERFLAFEGPHAARLCNNFDWLSDMSLIAFLRDIGKHFSVNAMVQRDSVRARLQEREHGISYTEFSYMLLQAYDFLILYRDFGCQAQLGGSDQWGNIVSGVDLVRRLVPTRAADETRAGAPALGPPFGLTSPLLTTRSGAKFGKTEQGTIWLDAGRTSPFALYQFCLASDDADVPALLRRLTLLPRDEIEALEARHMAEPSARVGQRALATAVVELCHGQGGVRAAERATTVLFTGDPGDADLGELQEIFADVPSHVVSAADWQAEASALRLLLVGEGRPFASNGEAKRKLQEGAVRLNGQKVTATLNDPVPSESLIDGRAAVIRIGRKQTWLVCVAAPTEEEAG